MKKRNLIISFIVILLFVYFGYKEFCLVYYDINRDTTEEFETFVKQFNISNTITIRHKEVEDNNYFEYQNIKIRNDFKKYKALDTLSSVEGFSQKLVLRDENNNIISAFWMGSTDTYVYQLKTDKTLFGTDVKRVTNVTFTNILEKNNINTDIELFDYYSKQKYIKNNIFTSVKKIKENYAKYFMISVMMPTMENITLINGDYNGYIFNITNNMKEVSILKNDKKYVFVFLNATTLTEEYLTDILSTIVIE